MTKKEYFNKQKKAADYLIDKAGIILKEEEIPLIELIDYGFEDNPIIGFQLYTYINTPRYCAKELILYPHQTCIEHKHPPVDGNIGKQETFRVRYGTLYLHIPGDRTLNHKAIIPEGSECYMNQAAKELVLYAGDMYTLQPDTWHWFQSGAEGCIVSEFSSFSTDENDILSDPRVRHTLAFAEDGVR